MIKSGKVSDFMKRREEGEVNFFLSSSVIRKEPSTKERDEDKRAMVLSIEIAQIKKRFDINKFPLAKLNNPK